MSRILACTDGSIYAPSVYDHAAWAAKRLGAGVEVLHVLDHHRETASVADYSGAIGADAREDLLNSLSELEAAKSKVAMAHGRAILQDADLRLKEAGVADVHLSQRHGSLIETLAEAEAEADLVVIGKRGEAADFATGHLGANLERVVRGSRRPVLVANRAFKPIERMLIAYDGGPSTRRALDHVVDNGFLAGIDCHLLMVGNPTPDNQERLALARERLAASGLEARATLVAGPPEEVIRQTVADEVIDLLVVGAYGHSRIRQFLVGSTTTQLIRTCLVPLLMFR